MQKEKIIKITIIAIIVIINIAVIIILINNVKSNIEKIENGDIEIQDEKISANQLISQNNSINLNIAEILQIILIIISLILVFLSILILVKCKKLLL